MAEPAAVYHVRDERGVAYRTTDTERAARLAKAGLRVTAVMEGGDGPQ